MDGVNILLTSRLGILLLLSLSVFLPIPIKAQNREAQDAC
jgi:hypothetical protein